VASANGFEAKFEGFVSMNQQYRCSELFVDQELVLVVVVLIPLGATVFLKAYVSVISNRIG